MIKLTNLTKRYGGFTAVNGINLEVPRGELFGFLGPNGAGKTTTLRMIAGILRPTSGNGGDRRHRRRRRVRSPRRAKLGFIPDRPFIYEKLTGAEFLRFVAGLYDQDGPEIEHRGARAARAVRPRGVARRAGRELQPRHAAEAHHLERVRAPPGGHRRRRADGRPRPEGGAHPQGSLSRIHASRPHDHDVDAHARSRRDDVRPHRRSSRAA